MTTHIEPQKPGRVYSDDSLRNQTVIIIRCSHEQKAAWREAAEITGEEISKTVRKALDANAKKVQRDKGE